MILEFDDSCLLWLNSYVNRWPSLDDAVGRLLGAYLLKFGVMVAALCWLWFRADPKQGEHRTTIIMTTISGFVGLFLARFLALTLPFRERPMLRADLGLVMPAHFESSLRTWSAFPSDHAVMAFAIVTGFWIISRPLGVLALVHSILIICLPRLYFGLHHPSDIIGGALIGIVITTLLTRETLRRPVSSFFLNLTERFAGPFYATAFLLLFQIVTMFNDLRSVAESVFKFILHASR